jgi:hypothetical protein
MADDCCSGRQGTGAARPAGGAAINTVISGLEFGAGLVAGSTAMVADAVNMLDDALVEGLFILIFGIGVGFSLLRDIRNSAIRS